jgi:hypothetical protein
LVAATVRDTKPGATTVRDPVPVIENAPASSVTADSLPRRIVAPVIGMPVSSTTVPSIAAR